MKSEELNRAEARIGDVVVYKNPFTVDLDLRRSVPMKVVKVLCGNKQCSKSIDIKQKDTGTRKEY